MRPEEVIDGKVRVTARRIKMLSSLYGSSAPGIVKEMRKLRNDLRRHNFRERMKQNARA